MEHGNILLAHAMLYLAAAVAAAVAAHRLGLASVAGYLIAGVAIGPFGLALVGQAVEPFKGLLLALFFISSSSRGRPASRPTRDPSSSCCCSTIAC